MRKKKGGARGGAGGAVVQIGQSVGTRGGKLRGHVARPGSARGGLTFLLFRRRGGARRDSIECKCFDLLFFSLFVFVFIDFL